MESLVQREYGTTRCGVAASPTVVQKGISSAYESESYCAAQQDLGDLEA